MRMPYFTPLRPNIFKNIAHVGSYLYFVFVFVFVFVFHLVLVLVFFIIMRMSYLTPLRPGLFKNIAHVGFYLYFVFVFVCVFVFVFVIVFLVSAWTVGFSSFRRCMICGVWHDSGMIWRPYIGNVEVMTDNQSIRQTDRQTEFQLVDSTLPLGRVEWKPWL